MPEADLAIMVGAAREAGEIALRHFAGSRTAEEKPGGLGPVTEADLEINRMLRDRLMKRRPTYGWLSEESEEDHTRADAERVFIIDPIDGTRTFIDGGRCWGHSLAVAERGRVIAAIVHMPLLERSYTAIEGYGAQCNGGTIWAGRRQDPGGAQVLVNSKLMRPDFWPGGVPSFETSYRPSLAYRVCLAAEGRFDAMLALRDTWEWDVAAGDLIAREAGAVVSDQNGQPTKYNNPIPKLPGIVVAGTALHRDIIKRLTSKPV